jgi:hypothetical protein
MDTYKDYKIFDPYIQINFLQDGTTPNTLAVHLENN